MTHHIKGPDQNVYTEGKKKGERKPIWNWAFERLPNITTMEIELDKYHPILKMFGFKKRQSPAKLEFRKFSHYKAVKYVSYMERQLHYASHERRFWFLASLILTKSICYKAVAWRKCEPTWYKDTKLDFINNVMKRLQTLDLDSYKFRRLDILKANGKIRPLGVPTMPWRLFNTLLNGILLHHLKVYHHPSQHGFYPGMGTDTAWKELIVRVLPAKYIYEVDFKEFYDRINLDYLRDFLLKTGMPKDLVYQVISWSRTMPAAVKTKIKSKGMPKEKVSTSGFGLREYSTMVRSSQRKTRKKWEIYQPQATDIKWNSIEDQMFDLNNHINSISKTKDLNCEKWDLKIQSKTENWKQNFNYFNGVAQGSALSPTLSTVILSDILLLNHPGVQFLYYADDGILFSDKPFDPDSILSGITRLSGVVAHTEAPKSR